MRRERRLRSWWRHERMTVAAELAVALHHSRGVGPAVPHEAPWGQTPASPVGRRLGVLEEPVPPVVVDRVQRHYMEDLETVCPFVQILDLPVPQTVDYVADALRILDFPIVEQVIEVPRICSPCPSRSPIPEPQSAEHLVEVPTVLSPTRIALQIAEQIVDTPVPCGRGQRRVQGFLPRQSSTATPSAEERTSERIVEQSVFPSSAKRTSERIEEQLVDTSPGGGLAQGSASSAGPADEDFAGVFRTFPRGKKSARAAASPSAELPREVSSWTPAAYVAPSGSDEWVELYDDVKSKTLYWNRRTRLSSWLPPEGVTVVSVGTMDEEEDYYYWHKQTRVSTYVLPPLPPG